MSRVTMLDLRDTGRGIETRKGLFDRSSEDSSTRRGGPRIRCPQCGWEPGRDSLWSCSCLHHWNTFDTSGRCPACGKQWMETCCPRCLRWSPHRDWYVEDQDLR